MSTRNLLAFDLGAESGRGIVGRFDGQRLTLEVVHRFPNGPVRVGDHLYWDILRLWQEMQTGLRIAAGAGPLDSVGVDTWGVDFALLGRGDVLLGNPRHYRDPHTEGIMEHTFQTVPAAEVFAETGIQFMRFNSLFQLLALRRDGSPLLEAARNLLFIPDLLHFWLCGVKANELSIASTSQAYDPTTRRWAWPLLERLDMSAALFGRIVPPGTKLGTLRPAVANDTGLSAAVPIVTPASHDTGAAVAAVPAEGADWCYLSSGTWSLLGLELDRPVINDAVRAANITNEVGVGGTIRFLKNIMGLWLVQECRRAWEKEGRAFTYDQLVEQAQAAPAFASIVEPDHASFLLPAHMPTALADFCGQTAQPPPSSPGAAVRCCLESLAFKYRWVLEQLERLTNQRIATIHIVGGGSQNRLLNQFTANACGRAVVAGPVEATAIGNVLTQALGLGLVQSLADVRRIVRASFPVERYEPQATAAWDEGYQRFLAIRAKLAP